MKNCDESMGGMVGARQVRLRDLKAGDFFKLTNKASAPVWVKGEYDRSEGLYYAYKYWDVCVGRLFSGDKPVLVGFSF